MKVFCTERTFPHCSCSKIAFAACQSARDQWAFTSCTNVWEKRFELITDAGEIGVNRGRLDLMAHIDCEERKSIWSRFDREIMDLAEREIGLEVGRICVVGR